MNFQPQVGDPLLIDGITYQVAAHPNAPNIPYGQEGRQATVYQLAAGAERRALKVFKARYRVPGLVDLADRQAAFAGLPGLVVCQRTVLTARRHAALLRQYPDLNYAVLMPWIGGPTWWELLLDQRLLPPPQTLVLARAVAECLTAMEERSLAHCDLSGPNLLLPILEQSAAQPLQSAIQLVDIEQMYGPGLDRPAALPAGSPGYAHRTANAGLWQPEADRFAGAVLLAEIIGWGDARVRAAAWGESYFDPAEMQQDGDRFRTLRAAVQGQVGEAAANLLVQAWQSNTLAECPTFGDWLLALPESGVAPRSRPAEVTGPRPVGPPPLPPPAPLEPTPALPAMDPSLALLFDAGRVALQQGDRARAQELLAAVARQRPDYARDGQTVARLLAQTATVPRTPARWAAGRIALLGLLVLTLVFAAAFGIWQFNGARSSTPTVQPNPTGSASSSASPVVQGTPLSAANADRIELLDRLGKGPAGALAWSADGQVLAVASSYGIYCYDPNTLSQIRFIPLATHMLALAFSPTENLLAAAGTDGKLRLFQSNTGQLVREWAGHSGPAKAVAFSPDGTLLLSGGMDTYVRVWRVQSGERVSELAGPHTIVSVAFNPDGTLIMAATDHAEVQIWQAGEGGL